MKRAFDLTNLKSKFKVLQDGPPDLIISGLTSNSKHVKRQDLFIAERGGSVDGHQYIESAIAAGATALLIEDTSRVPNSFKGLVLLSKNTRMAAPKLASLFYENPSAGLLSIGITGTNGKTSLTYILEHLFSSMGCPTGVIGTINHHLGPKIWPTDMTTPHPIELQLRLRQFCDAGAKALAMEASSHAIHQKRIQNIDFDIGIFTNLTRDHLDYHQSMEEYFQVKKQLFTEFLGSSKKSPKYAIINIDDPWGEKIGVPGSIKRLTYGSKNANFNFQLQSMNYEGSQFYLQTPDGPFEVRSPLLGVHNIYNVVAALAAGFAAKLSLEGLIQHLQSFQGVPGRLQNVPHPGRKKVLVDYAHSPDALENVLRTLAEIRMSNVKPNSRIICVFGCGGDRDKGKRPLMAKAAEVYSDFVFVTSDNPRTEDPLEIIKDIERGFSDKFRSQLCIEPDRAQAIKKALLEACDNDVVLIAGKGHEDYQIIGNKKSYFSDFETARNLL